MFRVGQRVICIDDNPYSATVGYEGVIWYRKVFELAKGNIYTVISCSTHSITKHNTVKLAEVADRMAGDEGYATFRFRPLITKSQSEDTAMFQKLLSPTHKEKV